MGALSAQTLVSQGVTCARMCAISGDVLQHVLGSACTSLHLLISMTYLKSTCRDSQLVPVLQNPPPIPPYRAIQTGHQQCQCFSKASLV